MKLKLILSLFAAAALSASAQSYKDGIEYFKADQRDNAKTLLERNLNNADTDKAQAYYYLGQIAVLDTVATDGSNLAVAEDFFQKGLAANPSSALSKVGMGELALLKGDENAAKQAFEEAVKINKKDAVVLTAIGRAYFNTDPVKYAKQIEKYDQQAFKANSKCPDIFMLRGDREAANREWGTAASNYENAILYSKDLPEAYVKYANAYFNVNPEFAINKLKEILDINPNSALAQRELAEKYYQNDQWALAAQAYGEYVKNPNHFTEDEVRYSVLLYYGKHYDESLALTEKLLAGNPDFFQAFQLNRINFLDKKELKDYAGAELQAEKFFAGGERGYAKFSATDYTSYGEVLQELGKDSLAIIAYEKAIEINPTKGDNYKALSSAYSGAKNYVRAAEVFQKYIDLGDYVTNDLVTLANRYQNVAATSEPGTEQKTNAINKAIETIDLVIAKVPDNHIPMRNKARMYMVKNDNKPSQDMVDTYAKMIELLDVDPANLQKRVDDYREAYQMTASFYIENEDLPKAVEYYEKMYSLDPENQPLRDYIDNLIKKIEKANK